MLSIKCLNCSNSYVKTTSNFHKTIILVAKLLIVFDCLQRFYNDIQVIKWAFFTIPITMSIVIAKRVF